MFRLLARSVRKKRRVIQLFLTSVVFFVCLNVSVRNFSDNDIALGEEADTEQTSSFGSKEPYIFLNDLESKYKPPPPPPADLPGYREPCTTVNAEASNAIGRAKTNQCKQLIADAACKLSHNKAIPVTVHNTCKRFENATFAKVRHFGCFRDDRNNRVLSLASKWFTEENSVERCIEFCREGMGAAYAGVEYGFDLDRTCLNDSDGNLYSPTSCTSLVGNSFDIPVGIRCHKNL